MTTEAVAETASDSQRPQRILLTGGRSPAALELARLFHAAGHRVYAAESAPYHLCRVSRAVERSFLVPPPSEGSVRFAAALCEIVREHRIDLLIPTCEEIFHISKELGRFAGLCRVLAAPLAEMDRLHHKGKFIATVAEIGLPVPTTVPVDTPDGWLPLLQQSRFREGLVLKPAYSRFASRTLLLDLRRAPLSTAKRSKEMVEELETTGVSFQRPWVAQELLRGEEWCTYSVAQSGRIAAHTAYRSRFRAGRGASIHYEPAEQPMLLDWVRRFVAGIGFTGQIAFDFMISPEGAVMPMECNPRATSGVHLFSSDCGLTEALLAPSALLAADRIASPASKAGRGAMLSAAMLSYGLVQAVRERMPGEWLRAWQNGRDVVFRRDDPKPFAEQFRLLAWTRKAAKRRNLTLQQASTFDIEWNGDS